MMRGRSVIASTSSYKGRSSIGSTWSNASIGQKVLIACAMSILLNFARSILLKPLD